MLRIVSVFKFFSLLLPLPLLAGEANNLEHNNKIILEMAQLSSIVYNFDDLENLQDQINNNSYVKDYNVKYVSKSGGYQGFIAHKNITDLGPTYVLVSKGYKSGLQDLHGAYSLYTDSIPSELSDAKKLFELIYPIKSHEPVIFAGHSMGGSISQYLNMEYIQTNTNTNARSYAFAFDSPGIQRMILRLCEFKNLSPEHVGKLVKNTFIYNTCPNLVNTVGRHITQPYVILEKNDSQCPPVSKQYLDLHRINNIVSSLESGVRKEINGEWPESHMPKGQVFTSTDAKSIADVNAYLISSYMPGQSQREKQQRKTVDGCYLVNKDFSISTQGSEIYTSFTKMSKSELEEKFENCKYSGKCLKHEVEAIQDAYLQATDRNAEL